MSPVVAQDVGVQPTKACKKRVRLPQHAGAGKKAARQGLQERHMLNDHPLLECSMRPTMAQKSGAPQSSSFEELPPIIHSPAPCLELTIALTRPRQPPPINGRVEIPPTIGPALFREANVVWESSRLGDHFNV